MKKLSIAFKYFRTIWIHKKWVFYYCNICGLTWRGIKHDMSKFSPIEFFESIKYYTDTKSPVDTCKEQNGYSIAWQHHKGRNDHHYEYWMDNFDKGGEPIRMPFEQATEMICDYLGAGLAYSRNVGEQFSYKKELDWFINKINNGCAMHEDTKKYVYLVLRNLSNIDHGPGRRFKDLKDMKYLLRDKYLNIDGLKRLYEYAIKLTPEKFELIRSSTENRNEETK